MIINTKQTNIRTIRHTDSKFVLYDGVVTCPRAGFELDRRMPKEYMMIIQECLTNGWLKPVAHVYGKELTMDAMR